MIVNACCGGYIKIAVVGVVVAVFPSEGLPLHMDGL
jgi:hypothetical protein